ncbi:G-type lectin S-receptor-like serine/threonine-protein kinase At1g11330 [Nymphaea colorata]|nr:G-type lectin S-receptor-like serine/threonine-protein kinase At1g11330 [Nymphaea colorata]
MVSPFLLFICFILFAIPFPRNCHALGNLTAGQTLNLTETIASATNAFVLGFFIPRGSPSQGRYLGIWYYDVPQTVVWVANRESPIPANDSGAVLLLPNNGSLSILDGNGRKVWSVGDLPGSGSDAFAELQDSGNLVITQSNRANRVWESFRYPTDTFLPNMQFIVNTRTSESVLWRSWKSPVDPAPGPFSLGLDRYGQQLYLWNGSVPIWRSGPLRGRTFTGISNMSDFSIFGFNPMQVGDEYSISLAPNFTALTRFALEYTGEIKEYEWSSSNKSWNQAWLQFTTPCDFYDRCGDFSVCYQDRPEECECLTGFKRSSGGCVRQRPIGCVDKNSSGADAGWNSGNFEPLLRMKPPDHGTLNQSIVGQEGCQQWCLSNCSCTAYAYAQGMGCLVWNEKLVDLQQFMGVDDGISLYIRLDSQKKKSPAVIYGTTLASAAICAVGLYLLWRYWGRLKSFSRKPKVGDGLKEAQSSDITSLQLVTHGSIGPINARDEESHQLPLIDFNTLRAATNDFSDANKLGEGGFGLVYKGKLPEGREIAVKRLSRSSGQGLAEFMNEVKLIAKFQHRNLVKLLACCIEKQEKMLIYEYMPNKSLDAFLFDPAFSRQLDWEKRFRIVQGIAKGLLYLHQDSRLKVVHRDLKPSNILLDATLNPKISDFGIARIFGADQSQVNTTRVVGTYGYMSPEYALEGRFSIKSDVFSFGVLVLEIVSGQKMTRFYHEELLLNLLGYSWKLWKEGNALELLDPSLEGQCSEMEVLKCINVGLLCVQDEATDRPSMCAVIQMLNSEAANFCEPQMPAYYSRRRLLDNSSSSSDAYPIRSRTVNGLTVSEVNPR